MGQTLTHGIYLPDEGERNCYNGLAGNWQLLDGAVGTVAEHTSQIAGKAPLVHTHTKSDITDFPVYGNSAGTICEGNDNRLSDARTPLSHTHTKSDITDFPALANVATSGSYNDLSNIPASFTPSSHTHGNLTNDGKVGTTANLPLITGTGGVVQAGSFGNAANTFCEGNDSRLSDARTPVSHTHGKADITDLFNSANKWTANQILKNTAITDYKTAPSADTGIVWNFSDNNNKYWGGIGHNYLTTGVSEMRISMTNWSASGSQGYWYLSFGATKDFSNVYFHPSSNKVVNLGSSSNQWKSVYAQTYYYNGTAWGLDKANVWSQSQTISANTNKAYIILNTSYILGEETPSTTKELGGVFFKDSNGNNAAYVNVGHEKTTGDVYTRILTRFKFDNGVKSISGSAVNTALDIGLTNSGEKFVRPSVNSEVNLGTSTNKWKSLNGVNPGALSLPDMSATGVDISSYIVYPTGETSLNLSGGSNKYTASENGWLVIVKAVTDCRYIKTVINTRLGAVTVPAASMFGSVYHCQPVPAGQTVSIVLDCDSAPGLYFYPCLGNV